MDPLGIAAATVASSALGGDSGVGDDNSATAAETPDGQNGKKKKNRCFNCKKKVGLTGKHINHPFKSDLGHPY